MELLVIRHGIAEDREAFAARARDDSERPLTAEGREKMRRGAAGLRRIVARIDVLASSPYARAMQTARLVASSYGLGDLETLEALVPDAALEACLRWLEPLWDAEVVAVVGHEPHLSVLVTWLISGRDDSRVERKKGGAALVGFDGRARAGGGMLRWLLTARQLRDVGR
jgi:phosphohistidine phosphatase